mmetsp:Transcript_73551/g.186434  ORF Transcript_73551/g.186434 Transcript_73551/m.186434 type:complete len:203 (+) Transcript_73551:566-1174(+)
MATTSCIKGKSSISALHCQCQIIYEARERLVHTNCIRVDCFQDGFLLRLPHHIHQGNAVLHANSHKHLSQLARCRGLDERRVPLGPHAVHEAERRHRVHERGGRLLRRHSVRHGHHRIRAALRLAVRGIASAVAEDSHDLAEQGLGHRITPGGHDDSAALVAGDDVACPLGAIGRHTHGLQKFGWHRDGEDVRPTLPGGSAV